MCTVKVFRCCIRVVFPLGYNHVVNTVMNVHHFTHTQNDLKFRLAIYTLKVKVVGFVSKGTQLVQFVCNKKQLFPVNLPRITQQILPLSAFIQIKSLGCCFDFKSCLLLLAVSSGLVIL